MDTFESRGNRYEYVRQLTSRQRQVRRPWEPPAMKAVGTISEVLEGGGGKLTLTGGDPGEARKQQGGQA